MTRQGMPISLELFHRLARTISQGASYEPIAQGSFGVCVRNSLGCLQLTSNARFSTSFLEFRAMDPRSRGQPRRQDRDGARERACRDGYQGAAGNQEQKPL